MDALVILGLIANTFSILFFLSPILIMIRLFQTRETQTIPFLLFFFTLLNCELWFIYGIQDDSWEIYLGNFIGLLLNTIYLTIFCSYLKNVRKKTVYIVLEFGVIAIIFVFFMNVLKNKSLTGLLAMICNIFMYLSPLQKTYEVFKFKTNAYIPLSTLLSLLVCTILWTTVGILKNDLYIIIPNIIGMVIGVFQTFLYVYFIDNNPQLNDKIDKSIQGSLPNIIEIENKI